MLPQPLQTRFRVFQGVSGVLRAVQGGHAVQPTISEIQGVPGASGVSDRLTRKHRGSQKVRVRSLRFSHEHEKSRTFKLRQLCHPRIAISGLPQRSLRRCHFVGNFDDRFVSARRLEGRRLEPHRGFRPSQRAEPRAGELAARRMEPGLEGERGVRQQLRGDRGVTPGRELLLRVTVCWSKKASERIETCQNPSKAA